MIPGEKRTAASTGRRLARHRALSDISRVGILDELRRAETPLDALQLAERVGLHHNTVRSHLEILLKAGLVTGETEKRDAPGRPRVVYRPTPGSSALDEPGGFRLLAHILASYLAASAPDPAASATEAGQAWGRYLVERPAPFAKVSSEAALQRIVQLFDELGFDPELAREQPQRHIHLHRCPFEDLATTHPEVTCSVHLGLIRGALSEMGAPVEGTHLDRFVTPSLCIAHFRDRGEERRRASAGAGAQP
jgi:predicted ArsR family transcriptional regulator